MTVSKKRPKLKSLSHGRPPTATKPRTSLSSKATRTIIRTHHTLEKLRAKALSEGNTTLATTIESQINAQGGLERYQQCSLQGQDSQRGGDSSKILMEWLSDYREDIRARRETTSGLLSLDGGPLRLLEVGALSVANACSRSALFDVERIDLNSQAEGIKQQDFMQRPLPRGVGDKFDVISLSLVLNFVPDAVGKGEMLRRTLSFLRQTEGSELDELGSVFPCLFLVLPAPCIANSRYMDGERLVAIMVSLGYELVQQKLSNKLVYYLWRAVDLRVERKVVEFKKVELRAGGARNNFSIVLK